MLRDNHHTYLQLREKFKNITFESFNCSVTSDAISAEYFFKIGEEHEFRPTLTLPVQKDFFTSSDKNDIEKLFFHIGMVELISYWKTACPPEIIVKPYLLNARQIDFWKKLYYNGLGEFFYTNGIQTTLDDFVTIHCTSEEPISPIKSFQPLNDRVIVPVGGGKDSIVTLELLKHHFKVIPFVINPLRAGLDTIEVAGFKWDQTVETHRTLDPLLLDLNKKGYLNGHTPFSALLAFVSLLAARVTHSRQIALSNESSANEPTVKEGANHQYSKSFEFESDFRNYCREFISEDFNYFSFLRPLNEFRIAGLFSRFPQYFDVFRSCNVGSKSGIWCGECPKCLFAYIILSPFISKNEMVRIFGYDLFTNENLIPLLDELAGISPVKPFECVGTIDEVNTALQRIIMQYEEDLPVLLRHYRESVKKPVVSFPDLAVENSFDENHFLAPAFMNILKQALHD